MPLQNVFIQNLHTAYYDIPGMNIAIIDEYISQVLQSTALVCTIVNHIEPDLLSFWIKDSFSRINLKCTLFFYVPLIISLSCG